MNPIIRNLVHVLRRFKLAAVLNILGLSVAFAAFMVIMMQLKFDFSFDRFHKDYQNVFRLEPSIAGTHYARISRAMGEHFFQSSPHITAGVVMQELGSALIHVHGEDENLQFREETVWASPGILDVFTFDIVEGTTDTFGETPEVILIPQSLARRMFGNESAVGRQLVATPRHDAGGPLPYVFETLIISK